MKPYRKFPLLFGMLCLVLKGPAFAYSYEGATEDYELPQGFSFYNEVSSDIVEAQGSFYNYHRDRSKPAGTYKVEFAGISEKVGVSYDSEKLWFELAPTFSLKDNNQHWEKMITYQSIQAAKLENKPIAPEETDTSFAMNNDDLSFAWTDLDWGIRFTPFDIADFVLHHDTWTPGGYMPLIDRHVGGNLTGDGFGIVLKPVDGLRIGLEVPFSCTIDSAPNYLNAELEDERMRIINSVVDELLGRKSETLDYRFAINAGADYRLFDMLTIGAFVTNILNRDVRGYGLYANADIAFVNASIGYTYNGERTLVSYVDFPMKLLIDVGPDTLCIGGHHKVNIAATASFGDLSVGMESLFNIFKTQSIYDFYAGLKVGYDLLPGKFNLALAAGVACDFGNYKSTGQTRYREQGAANIQVTQSKKGSGNKNEISAPTVEIQPAITYATGKNTFKMQANLEYVLNGDGTYVATFPVSWKYTF